MAEERELDTTELRAAGILYAGVADAYGANFVHLAECPKCGTRNPDTAPDCAGCGLTAAEQEDLERAQSRGEAMADRPYDDDSAGTDDHNRKVE